MKEFMLIFSGKDEVQRSTPEEMKEMVNGYIIVKTGNIDEATKLADGCPTLGYGGSVEVRNIMMFNQ